MRAAQPDRRTASVIAIAAIMLLGACTTVPEAGPESAFVNAWAAGTSTNEATQTDSLIARNLVEIVTQINDLPPWSTTVQINEPNSSFGSALFNALEAAGYGVQRVPEDQGRHYVSYRTSAEQSESGRTHVYSMWVGGEVAVERRFREIEGTLLPISPVILTGVRPKTINVDDRYFAAEVSAGVEFPSGAEFRDDGFELIQSRERPLLTTGGSQRNLNATTARDEALEVEKILTPYRPKRQTTLSFPTAANNVLGDPNKRAVVAISEAYRASTDIFLVSGCRPASFASPAEPETDSMERAQRVRAELLNRGYAAGVILEETCEPGRYNQSLPRRSVVLTLERLRDT